MTRRRRSSGKRKTGRKATLQKWLDGLRKRLRVWLSGRPWRSWNLDLSPLQRDLLGLGLMILAILTLLGLLQASSGALLAWWALTLRRLFGWGAYPLALGLGLLGLGLVWEAMAERVVIGPGVVVGLELLLLVGLVATHLTLVVGQGSEEAMLAAEDGQGGGYVGWALATLLVEGVGSLTASLVLLALFLVALYLFLSDGWLDVRALSQQWGRRVAAAWSRWQTARQGNPVAPELQEPPWWETEPEPDAAKLGPKKRAKSRASGSTRRSARRKKPRPRPTDGGLPPLDLFDPASSEAYGDTDVRRKVEIIEETLASFGVPAQVVEVNQGPTVTQFGLDPGYVERRTSGGETRQQRVRVRRIAGLSNDLALALAAAPIRIEAPVPGRSVVGLEVPNEKISLVSLRGVLESQQYFQIDSPLAIALGEDVSGHPVAVDLALMPHLLIAGATGSGKSVCVNSLICCLLANNTPEQLRMLMIDPKMVELIGYNDIPHLLAPVIVDVEQVVRALAWVTRQMDARYKLFHQAGTRNLEQYNQRMRRRKGEEPLPALAVFIDELADLMMVAPDEVERHICRVAQMGRATGIHLAIATQRPSVDVVTGLIKANFPARISFAVTSQVDSRVILDQAGAENLLGRGDMLFLSPQQASPIRLQGCFVSDKEIDRLCSFWRGQGGEPEQAGLFPPWMGLDGEEEADDLLGEAIALAEGRKTISTSFVQRRLHIGFPRAARIMDQLEEQGAVGPDRGGGRGREVLLGKGIDFKEIEERLPGQEPD
jgi:S-DNA-T family DNA segregation ATPase FtsK/SpoIIIE